MSAPAFPASDGSLMVRLPTPETRFDFGNRRLFGAVNGVGEILSLNLAEGVSVITRWKSLVQTDSAEVHWQQAEASGRTFILQGQAGTVGVQLETHADAQRAALVQRWRFQNTSNMAIRVLVTLSPAFDLHQPVFQVQPAHWANRLRRWLSSPAAENWLGPRRWALENWLGSRAKIKRIIRTAAVELMPHGCTASADGHTAQFSSSIPLELNQSAPDRLIFSLSLAPSAECGMDWLLVVDDQAPTVSSVLESAQAYRGWLAGQTQLQDPFLRSMFLACLNTAISMDKELPSGFGGLWAGPGYAYPPRIYFRDSYWTAQALLPVCPQRVRNHLLNLARGVHADGQCPSGVFDPAVHGQAANQPLDWLPDHHDSPAYFILLAADYLHWSADWEVLQETIGGQTIWQKMMACADYLHQLDRDGDGLPEKPRSPNDWADNVLRSDWVTYDIALQAGAFEAMQRLAEQCSEVMLAGKYQAWRANLVTAARKVLWDEHNGYFVDYRRKNFTEDHFSLDTILAIRFGLADQAQTESILAAAHRLLQSRNNPLQPWGDWGVMCCFPPYRKRTDTFSKSAQPYHYHSGAEWPYLSAIYAELCLEHQPQSDDGWYALTRWWQRSLEQGWLTPVEYTSPGYPPGAFLQGWSSLAALALWKHAQELEARSGHNQP